MIEIITGKQKKKVRAVIYGPEGIGKSTMASQFPKPLFIDIELELAPTLVEGIHDTVNYETLASKARALAAEGHVELVETFAERLVGACLEDPRVLTARVRIEKPEALEGAEAAGVEVVAART